MELVGYEDVEARSHEALASLVVHKNNNRLSTNEKHKQMDYDLLDRVLNEIKIKKDEK